jgi:hypothetical protein
MEKRTVRRILMLSIAAGALALGLLFATVQAAPAGGGLEMLKPLAAESSGTVDKVQFRGCWERCRDRGLPPSVCRQRCSGGDWGGGGERCYERCRERGLSRWICRERCGGAGCYERCRDRGHPRFVCRRRCGGA